MKSCDFKNLVAGKRLPPPDYCFERVESVGEPGCRLPKGAYCYRLRNSYGKEYVGQTMNPHNRMNVHVSRFAGWGAEFWKVPRRNINDAENALIWESKKRVGTRNLNRVYALASNVVNISPYGYVLGVVKKIGSQKFRLPEGHYCYRLRYGSLCDQDYFGHTGDLYACMRRHVPKFADWWADAWPVSRQDAESVKRALIWESKRRIGDLNINRIRFARKPAAVPKSFRRMWDNQVSQTRSIKR